MFISPAVQLWSLRDQLAHSPVDVAQKLQSLNIESVEATDLEEVKTLRAVFNEHGISVTSSFLYWRYFTECWDLHSATSYPWPAAPQSFQALADESAELGLQFVSLGYLTPQERTPDQWQKLIDRLNHAGEVFARNRIQLCYHNHAFEFEAQAVNGNARFFDVLINQAEHFKLELDTFWCHATGNYPLTLIDQFGDRIHALHLKNILPGFPQTYDDQIMPPTYFTSLGLGEIDMQKVLDKAQEQAIKHAIVEQDFSTNIYMDLQQSMQFLNAKCTF